MNHTIVRFLLLVLLLNVVRYIAAFPLEMMLVFPGLFGAMESAPGVFNVSFTTGDWITSYVYNFILWTVSVFMFHRMAPVVGGKWIIKSVKIFFLPWLLFVSVSAIYMNHYAHTKMFYVYTMLDSVITFGIVAVANGLLYPRIMGKSSSVG